MGKIEIRIDTEKEWYQVQKYLKNIGFRWNSEVNSGKGTSFYIARYNEGKSIIISIETSDGTSELPHLPQVNKGLPRLMYRTTRESGYITVKEFFEVYYPFISNEKEDYQNEFIEKLREYMLNSKRVGE